MMQNLRNKQHGVGFLGWSSILGLLAFFIFTGLRISPLYTEKFAVIAAMENAASQSNAKTLTIGKIRRSFRKNVEVNSNTIRFSSEKNLKNLVKVVTDKKLKKKYLHVVYEGRNEYIKDIKLLLEFDHKVELGGSASE